MEAGSSAEESVKQSAVNDSCFWMKLAWKTGKNNSRVLIAEGIAKLETKTFQ